MLFGFKMTVAVTVSMLSLSLPAISQATAEQIGDKYSGTILSEESLGAYWRMEGDLSDTKSGARGILHGGAARFLESPGTGKALALGKGEFVIVEKTPHLDLPETTVELLFRIEARPTANACLLAKRSQKQTRFSIHLSRDLTQLQIWNGRDVIPADFPISPLPTGQWHHLVVTASKSGLSVYLDGVLSAQIPGASFNFSAGDLPLLIGAATPTGYEQCECVIDELAVYSRVVAEDEVLRHVDAIGWTGRRKTLLVAKEKAVRQKEAREAQGRREKMGLLAELMSDTRLVAPGKTRVYRDEHLTAISFPLGGIGSGCIQLNGKAERAVWQIFNNFKGVSVPHSFFAVRVSGPERRTVARVLQTSPVGPFEAMKSLSFRGEYPFASYDFEDASLPVSASMEAFNPLIPLNARDSAIPCAIFNLTARNTSPRTVEVTFLAAQQNAVGFNGGGEIKGRSFAAYGRNINRVLKEKDATILHMTADVKKDSLTYGDMAVAVIAEGATATASWGSLDSLLTDVLDDGELSGPETAGPSPTGETLDGAVAARFSVEPGQTRTVAFVLTWFFPNARHGHEKWGGEGNMYSNWWDSALGVAREVRERFDELSRTTRLYHDTFYASNLPRWLLDRISSQVAVLRSKTCFWTKDGYFGGWEGCCPESGCCHGNCAHVWHYAQAHARLFPSIARRMREEALRFQTEDGKIPFRQPDGGAACDGQFGEVLAAYREHLCSVDRRWLDENWPRVRKAMDYVIAAWDRDEDGVLAGAQHNTLDWEVGGSTSWLGSLYLAALAASEKMAELPGDSAVARRYHRIRKSGAAKQNETLWNSEYFIQIPDPVPQKDYNDGCHIDQVLGEWWASQLGLDRHYPEDHLRSALRSLLKYNFQTDFAGIPQKPRKFVSEGDAGMQMITWPKAPRPYNHTLYADEAMSGFEYAAAATMIQSGMLKEGFAVVKAVSDRYDGRLRTGLTESQWASWGYSGNPFGDDECGKFYARAMSVWSVLLACQGCIYDGPAGTLGFKPVWQPEDHASFFTSADGWGSFVQKRRHDRQTDCVELKCGSLRVGKLIFELPNSAKLADASVTVASKKVEAHAEQLRNLVRLTLAQWVTAKPGKPIEVMIVF